MKAPSKRTSNFQGFVRVPNGKIDYSNVSGGGLASGHSVHDHVKKIITGKRTKGGIAKKE